MVIASLRVMIASAGMSLLLMKTSTLKTNYHENISV